MKKIIKKPFTCDECGKKYEHEQIRCCGYWVSEDAFFNDEMKSAEKSIDEIMERNKLIVSDSAFDGTKYNKAECEHNHNITVRQELQGIKFCPYCGKQLVAQTEKE